MGLNYSIDLYFNIEDLEKALLATAKIAVYNADQPGVQVLLPNQRTVTLPFTTFERDAQLTLTQGGRIDLKTTLLFEFDEAIGMYHGNWKENEIIRDGVPYRIVGIINLDVVCGFKFARLGFWAHGTGQSKMFVASGVIQRTLLEVLNSAHGVLGLIDIETKQYIRLENPKLSVHSDSAYSDYLPNEHSVDRFVSYILTKKALQEETGRESPSPYTAE